MEKINSLLIVDDDVSNLLELTQIFQNDYKLYTSKDGAGALEKAEKSKPDLILLDIIMPEKNGFEVLSELKQNDLTKNIPVIFMTGIREDEDESEGLSLGALYYIRKPFDAKNIKLKIFNLIQLINNKCN